MLDIHVYDPSSPKAIGDLVGNRDVWARTGAAITSNAASHMVLVGPAGCGKSIFLRIALAGRQVLRVDCTANPGLRDVRNNVRVFARGSRSPEGNLRWIIFEHADALACDTQAFLRRMLETTAGNTRIVFECRDVGTITEPILSRVSIVTVHAPNETEVMYEVQHRTQFCLGRDIAEEIAKLSYGNVRKALTYAVAVRYCGAKTGFAEISALLARRPTDDAWVEWAVETETACRDNGLDLRDILRLGWPSDPIVAHTCATWSRLGGTSARTLFFDCVARLCGCAEKKV